MYVHAMMYEYRMLLRYFPLWENKSLTADGEYKEAESFISDENDEWIWFSGDSLFLFEDILLGIDSTWE